MQEQPGQEYLESWQATHRHILRRQPTKLREPIAEVSLDSKKTDAESFIELTNVSDLHVRSRHHDDPIALYGFRSWLDVMELTGRMI